MSYIRKVPMQRIISRLDDMGTEILDRARDTWVKFMTKDGDEVSIYLTHRGEVGRWKRSNPTKGTYSEMNRSAYTTRTIHETPSGSYQTEHHRKGKNHYFEKTSCNEVGEIVNVERKTFDVNV